MKTKLTILFILVAIIFSFSQEKVQKYSKARIYYTSTLDLEKLASNGLAVDHGLVKKNVFIESVFSETELKTAKQLGYQVKVLINDMRNHVSNLKRNELDAQNSSCNTANQGYTTPNHFELGGMGGFYTYAEMLSELDEMHTLYPNLITTKAPISTFKTYENRDIYFVKISDNPSVNEAEPEILFTAIHHAREPESMQQLIFYMWYLLENYGTNTEITSLVDHTQQYFIPVVNPDGYIYNQTTDPNGGGYWRKNRRANADGSFGVDNNRNYSYHWGEAGVSSSGSGETWAGTAPFSESENQAVKWFCEQHNFKMAINNHTYSGLLLYPFGYASNTPTTENSLFDSISSLMVKENGYVNEIASALYPAAGDSDDWMYGDTSTKNKIYAMTPEIGHSFWPSQSEIIPLCKKMMFHNLTAVHLITNYAVLEDQTPEFISNLSGNFEYSLQRLGLEEPANFTVSVQPISANISTVGNPQTYNSMNYNQIDNGMISYTLSNSIQDGDLIEYKIIVNNGAYNAEYLFSKVYGTPQIIFSDVANSTSNYNNTSWQTTTSDYHSAPSAITDSKYGDYQNNINHTIELANTIDLANVQIAKLSFFTKWNIESGWDYVQFEISTDNGVHWIPQCGKFTHSGNTQQGINGEPMYDGNQNTWVKEEIDLSDYLGENIKFRFQIVSDNYTTEDGFYFDDFEVKVINNNNSAALADDELVNFNIYPNPFNDKLTITIPNLKTEASLSIYAVNGQSLINTTLHQSTEIIDLKSLNSGVYFVKIKTDNAVKTIKIIKH